VVATSLYEDGTPAPFAGLHADVVVADYPPGLPAYTTELARSGPPARSLIGHTRARVRVAAYEGSLNPGGLKIGDAGRRRRAGALPARSYCPRRRTGDAMGPVLARNSSRSRPSRSKPGPAVRN